MCVVHGGESPRDPQADRPRLATRSSSFNVRCHIVLSHRFCYHQRLENTRPKSVDRKVFIEFLIVHLDFAGARSEMDSSDRSLASSDDDNMLRCCHALVAELNGFGLLSRMRVFARRVNFQFLENASAEPIVRQHTFDRVLKDEFGFLLQKLFKRPELPSTRIAGIVEILLQLDPPSRDLDFRCIDDDHIVADVNVRCELWFVFPAENSGDMRRHATKDVSVGVNEIPFFLNV